MTNPTDLLISSVYGGASTRTANEQQRNTGPEPLASSARGSPVFDSSTMTYESKPNSSYDEKRIEYDQRPASVSGGAGA